MYALLPVFALLVPGIPAGCAVFAARRWLHDRRVSERPFIEGRERRLLRGVT